MGETTYVDEHNLIAFIAFAFVVDPLAHCCWYYAVLSWMILQISHVVPRQPASS